MWSDLVGPVVQIAGDVTVGSGVMLESRRREAEDGWTTYLITSWHVVRDIYGSPENVDEPVDIKIYVGDGTTAIERAITLAYDVPLDVALLRLQTDEPVANGARLAPRERVETIHVFDAVYAVGCPLGNDPIPTAGEVAATDHLVDGETALSFVVKATLLVSYSCSTLSSPYGLRNPWSNRLRYTSSFLSCIECQGQTPVTSSPISLLVLRVPLSSATAAHCSPSVPLSLNS
jgi:hypothetical protein